MNSLRPILVLIATISLCPARHAASECLSDEVLVAQDEDNDYCMKRSAYKGSPAETHAQRFCQARIAVTADQNAIKAIGFNASVEQCELFAKVAEEQKGKIKHDIFDALLDQGLDGTEAALKSAKSLNPWNVNRAVKLLESKRFAYPSIVTALREIAAIQGKPAMFEAYKKFAKEVKAAKEGWDTASEMATDPDSANLRLLVGALKILNDEPALGLAITGFNYAESLVYLGYVTGSVNELSLVSDENLQHLKDLSQKLHDDVSRMTDARSRWRQSTGYSGANPLCTR